MRSNPGSFSLKIYDCVLFFHLSVFFSFLFCMFADAAGIVLCLGNTH